VTTPQQHYADAEAGRDIAVQELVRNGSPDRADFSLRIAQLDADLGHLAILLSSHSPWACLDVAEQNLALRALAYARNRLAISPVVEARADSKALDALLVKLGGGG